MSQHVLVLHGALGSQDQLKPLRGLLEQSGYTTHAFNFTGHCREPFVKTFGIQAFASQLIRFLDNHKLQSVHVFGYSMGGYVALYASTLRPNLLKSIATLGTKFDWNPESAAKEVRKLKADKIIEKVPAFARILEQRHGSAEWRKLLEETSAMMLGLGNDPLLTIENLRQISTPSLIMLGEQDDMADAAFSKVVADTLPNGQFRTLHNTPHPIEKVDVDKLTADLVQFFKSH